VNIYIIWNMTDLKIVAEAGINHNGDINIAKNLISMAYNFGCNYIKFQKKTPDLCVPESQKNITINTPWGYPMKYIDYKKKMEFNENDYKKIDRYATLLGIEWFASVWDIPSLEFMIKFNPPYIKIPSALITNKSLLEKCKESNIPCIISTGMSIQEDIDNAVKILGSNLKYILHTTSSYPTPNIEMNMKKILTLQNLYGKNYKIGFSNHCSDIIYTIQSYILGAEMIEFHITLDRNFPGTDQWASIGPTGLDKIMKHLNNIAIGYGNGNIEVQKSEYPVMEKLRKNNG